MRRKSAGLGKPQLSLYSELTQNGLAREASHAGLHSDGSFQGDQSVATRQLLRRLRLQAEPRDRPDLGSAK